MPDDLMSSPTALPAPLDTPRPPMQWRGIVPADFQTSLRMAKVIAASGMAPKSYYSGGADPIAAVWTAIQLGAECGLSPMASVQNIAVIGGRPGLFGPAMLAVVIRSGTLARHHEHVDGEGDARAASCTVQRVGGDEKVFRFSVADAKRARLWGKSGPWTEYPDRMLLARARTFALRDVFPDVLLGLSASVEELQDIPAGQFQDVPCAPESPPEPPPRRKTMIDEDGCEIPPPASAGAGSSAAPSPERSEKAAIERFWLKSSLNLCQASSTPNDLIAKLLRAIPLAPSLTMLERLMADQTADILRLAMTADEWDAVESARHARWEVLVQESETEEEAADGNMAP
jgi:hypothetical protein